jgi:hypothetical protein
MTMPRLRTLAVPLLAVLTTGCVRFVPIPKFGDKDEAISLARLLKNSVPELQELIRDQLLAANELKVMLDVASDKDYSVYSARFEGLVSRLVVIRASRRQLLLKLRQATYRGVLPSLYQIAADQEMREYLVPVTSWIQIAHNFKLRAEFGTKQGFPEFDELKNALNLFLGSPPIDPLSSEIGELEKEYKLADSDI